MVPRMHLTRRQALGCTLSPLVSLALPSSAMTWTPTSKGPDCGWYGLSEYRQTALAQRIRVICTGFPGWMIAGLLRVESGADVLLADVCTSRPDAVTEATMNDMFRWAMAARIASGAWRFRTTCPDLEFNTSLDASGPATRPIPTLIVSALLSAEDCAAAALSAQAASESGSPIAFLAIVPSHPGSELAEETNRLLEEITSLSTFVWTRSTNEIESELGRSEPDEAEDAVYCEVLAKRASAFIAQTLGHAHHVSA